MTKKQRRRIDEDGVPHSLKLNNGSRGVFVAFKSAFNVKERVVLRTDDNSLG